MKVVIIKYNAGNIRSMAFAMERLGIDYSITDNQEEIKTADKVIFPGVGEARSTMDYLQALKLDLLIKDLKQPVLGVCLGMQLMCAYSEENDTKCLGIFDETVKQFIPKNAEKVPHMGWNSIALSNSWIDASLDEAYMYFVHSYYVPVNQNTAAITDYIQPFSAALQKDNFYAVQFHPEKSATVGENVLRSFLNIQS
ncbi:imidazole glycerol phosphate synthase subunit HisH [Chryseotalea sanaruensis]|uniref:Imidazole glycerol phosphate synthase subunit HisH n=1 Tax=Chryseotalea sanaruensis TaxID=2482724 RepID=A0A401U9A2_9BACT|nr:imidazole glycerol phosphate synthase subunit HisH [Chryseotalea sanaruensis]GCC51488.1 imidazole glycerol phosphate synthase subunit HisH [Chryseotalea sanaruensis]